MLRAAASNALTQGIGNRTGLQHGFSWTSVAASGLAAGAMKVANDALFTDVNAAGGRTSTAWVSDNPTKALLASSSVSALVSATTRLAVVGGRLNWEAVAADALSGFVQGQMGRGGASSSSSNGLREAELNREDDLYAQSWQDGRSAPASRDAGVSAGLGKLGSGTYGLDASLTGLDFMTVDPTKSIPATVRAGDYNGSLERIARAQLGSGASQREINNYVGQLFEVNGIGSARTIGGNREITLPDANTQAATVGLGLYGRDIAYGESLKAVAAQAATVSNAQELGTTPASKWDFLNRTGISGALYDAMNPSLPLRAGPTQERLAMYSALEGRQQAIARADALEAPMVAPDDLLNLPIKGAAKLAVVGGGALLGIIKGGGREVLVDALEHGVAKGVAAEGKTVLGHYPEYKSLAESLSARRFNIPESAWNKMSEAERWGANQKFLDRMISRGDDVILATPLDKVRPGSYFARELEYMSGRGYGPSADGTRLILQGGR